MGVLQAGGESASPMMLTLRRVRKPALCIARRCRRQSRQATRTGIDTMSSVSTSQPEPMIIISLRYADAPRMYDWLIEAFGFEKHAAYYSEDGKTLLHGELRMGSSFVMLGSSEGNEFGKLVSRPAELGGTTASPYIATDDIDARCERARKAGAEICMEPTDQPYGSRDFICMDPEGHVWCFGTYRPA
jgi:uncharacterized glyoxalase superfamily protein PhnB